MYGTAVASGAGTVVNALATGRGAAFALDVSTRARVALDPTTTGVDGEIADAPTEDTTLIERCVERVVDGYGDGEGGRVRTDGEVPLAAGLKSSSAAANATVLATLAALDVAVGPDGSVSYADACRIGVAAARDAGVTVTGAFDDAAASMLGGLVVTDNTADELLTTAPFDYDAVVWTPPARAYSADADVAACEAVAPMAELAIRLAREGSPTEAMTVNGLAFSAALEYPTDPAVAAMPHAAGVSLSGTGPSVVAVGEGDALDPVAADWRERPGEVVRTTTTAEGARIRDRGDGDPPNGWW
ncbi:shikimate kinase [Halobaculum sp. MBLA0147]|uniref:shikimate kinase n=1 Tax=Halobaculum sp. MBLA0147 TaxID=3079934 RepID=UPI003525B241